MGKMLSDRIENLILEQMNKKSSEPITLSRREIADLLGCAPSQVTYVINTRFSGNQNFEVESRRGNGGYIRIRYSEKGKPRNHVNAPVPAAAAGRTRSHPETPLREGAREPGTNSIILSFKHYLDMLRSYQVISEREYKMISALAGNLFHICPVEDQLHMSKKMVQDINRILGGGQ